MSKSKRKAFNFFLSYYEIGKELADKDRLQFYDAVLLKQFENIEMDLNGMAKFAYISQRHSINTQVKGYFDKTKDPMFDPSLGGRQGGSVAPSVQVQEKEKGQVQEKEKVNISPNIIQDRKLKFAESLKDYLDLYGREMINEFFKYWTEPNKTNSKLKFELEKTWSIKLRLERWAKNNKNFKVGNNGNKQQTADERLQEAKSRILGEDTEFGESKSNNQDLEFTSFENVGDI